MNKFNLPELTKKSAKINIKVKWNSISNSWISGGFKCMHEYDVFLKAECNMDPLVWSLYRKNGFFHVRFKNFWMLSTVECVIWLWITMCISNLLVGSYNSELTVPDVHIQFSLDGVFSLLAQCSPSKQCSFFSQLLITCGCESFICESIRWAKDCFFLHDMHHCDQNRMKMQTVYVPFIRCGSRNTKNIGFESFFLAYRFFSQQKPDSN